MFHTALTFLTLIAVTASQAVAVMSHVHEGTSDTERPHFHLSGHSHFHEHSHVHDHHHHHDDEDRSEEAWTVTHFSIGHVAGAVCTAENDFVRSQIPEPPQVEVRDLPISIKAALGPRAQRRCFFPERENDSAFAHARILDKIRLLL